MSWLAYKHSQRKWSHVEFYKKKKTSIRTKIIWGWFIAGYVALVSYLVINIILTVN